VKGLEAYKQQLAEIAVYRHPEEDQTDQGDCPPHPQNHVIDLQSSLSSDELPPNESKGTDDNQGDGRQQNYQTNNEQPFAAFKQIVPEFHRRVQVSINKYS
jgi:hypothetical protein